MTLRYDHLLGIPFTHGKDDCFALARRFYFDNWGVKLTNYARPDDWWDKDLDLYMKYFVKEGFQAIDVNPRDYLPGDGFLMNVISDKANHCAMYLGDGKILHHRYGLLSCVDAYDHGWRLRNVAVLRHKQVVIAPSELRTFDLMEALPPQFRASLLQHPRGQG